MCGWLCCPVEQWICAPAMHTSHPLPSFLCTSKPLSPPPSMALCWQGVNRSGAVPWIECSSDQMGTTHKKSNLDVASDERCCICCITYVMFGKVATHKYLAAISCIHTLSDRIEYVLSQSCAMFANRQKISILHSPTSEMALLWNSSELKMTTELFWLYLNLNLWSTFAKCK